MWGEEEDGNAVLLPHLGYVVRLKGMRRGKTSKRGRWESSCLFRSGQKTEVKTFQANFNSE